MATDHEATESVSVSRLSLAYSDVVAHASALHEGSWLASQPPLGPRVGVQIPEPQWRRLADAICAITGGESV